MADPVTWTAGAIASLAVQKFLESGAGELGKKFTTEAITKMGLLWEQVKTKLMGKSAKLDEALVKVEQGDLRCVGYRRQASGCGHGRASRLCGRTQGSGQ